MKSESFFAYGANKSEQSLSINKRRTAGGPSIKFISLVKKIIEGTRSLKSVKEIFFSLIFKAIRDEIEAEILNFSSPENSEKTKARESKLFACHEIKF